MLARHCVSCHGAEKQKGGLRLDRAADFRKGGDSGALDQRAAGADFLLISILEGRHPDIARMPKDAPPLSPTEIHQIRDWLGAGAPWPESLVVTPQTKADASWWSLQPLQSPPPPNPAELPPHWTGSIDRFVFAGLATQNLTPSEPANRRALIRRATYDVTGLPPTPEAIQTFVDDPSPDAYERLIERLLASPRYGERWARLWLDVVRFGESNGYERNVLYAHVWPYRDYVIRALNQDLPFDRFVREQLAGDVLAPHDTNTTVATAFLVCGPFDDVGNQDAVAAAQIRANHLDDMVRATSEAFLGLTIGCARCHDHKFDPVPAADYYRLQAAFAGVRHGERSLATPAQQEQRRKLIESFDIEHKALLDRRSQIESAIAARVPDPPPAQHSQPSIDPYLTEDSFEPTLARHVRLVLLSNNRDPRSAGGIRLDEVQVWTPPPGPTNVASARLGASARGPSGRIAEDFAGAYGPELTIDDAFDAKWIAGNPPHLTLTLAQPTRISRVAFSSDRPQALPREHDQNMFAGEYRIEVSTDNVSWTSVASSRSRPPINEAFARHRKVQDHAHASEREELAALARKISELDRKRQTVPPLPAAWAGVFAQPSDPTWLLVGGDPQRKGPVLPPASPQFLPAVAGFTLATNAPEAERRLELARWIADSNNPLTPRVIANRIWQSHFGIGLVDTPSDFGYLGGRPSHPELLDWLAQELIRSGWRLKPIHRQILLSQTYRQNSEFRRKAAQLDRSARLLWRFPPRRLSAEEIRDSLLAVADCLALPAGGPGFRLYRYLEDNVATYLPLDRHPPATWQRAVFHQSPRAARVDLLTDFDCPDNATPSPARTTTTSPLQALTLLNHQFTIDMAARLAVRLESPRGRPLERQIQELFLLTFARLPTPRETELAAQLARDHGLAALCRAQFNANEFLFIH